MRFVGLRPRRRRRGAACPALYYLAGLDLHRGDVRHQGGGAARRGGAGAGAGHLRHQPAGGALPGRRRRLGLRPRRRLLRRRHRGALASSLPHGDVRHPRAARRSSRRTSRSCPTRAGSSGTRWAGTARWRWRCATRTCYRSVSAFAPDRRAVAGALGPARRSPATSGETGPPGPRTTPASWCARGRFPRCLLVDQGTADKFLDAQLKPELFEAACAEAGQNARAPPARRLRPQLLLHRHLRRRAPRAPRARSGA